MFSGGFGSRIPTGSWSDGSTDCDVIRDRLEALAVPSAPVTGNPSNKALKRICVLLFMQKTYNGKFVMTPDMETSVDLFYF